MVKFVKFTFDTNKTYFLPVGEGTLVGQAADDSVALTVGFGGSLATIAFAADSDRSMQVSLSKAIYDVLSDSQISEVTWVPGKAISAVTVA
jgi:hypothetical protein